MSNPITTVCAFEFDIVRGCPETLDVRTFDAVFIGHGESPRAACAAARNEYRAKTARVDSWILDSMTESADGFAETIGPSDTSFYAALRVKFGHPTTIEETLARAIECRVSDLSELTYDTRGLRTFDGPGAGQYVIGTEAEADKAAHEAIVESLWAFRPEFLASHCAEGIDASVIRAIQENDKCEDNNGAMLALVKTGSGIDAFVSDAIESDGRGNFLASYDSEEIEIVGPEGVLYFVYRN